jgi:septal ring factor EnvC (AmiA/AmiB activator)
LRAALLLSLMAAALLPPSAKAAPAEEPRIRVTVEAVPRPRPPQEQEEQKPARDAPLDLSKALPGKAMEKLPSSAAQLGTLNAEIARDKPALANAKQKSEQLSQEATGLRQKLISTAARIENLEQETITLGGEIERLENQDRELTAGFERDRISVTKLLAILERLQHDMPPALAVRPDDALAAARGAMLVGASLPPVYAEAARLARRINALKQTRAALSSRRTEASSTFQQLTKARADLEVLTAQKEAEAQTAGEEYSVLKSRMADIAAKAADFQALVKRVSALRHAGVGEEGITVVTASNTGSLGPLTKGSLLQPVVGTIAKNHDDAPETSRNPGLTYLTRGAAQVIAPADGRILFAGPYHKSGQVLILEITTGYDLVLAGLGRVTVRLNDEVLAGEPVGTMPAESGSAAGSSEQLYFELRHDGHGLDPRPWLSLELRKAKRT